jgi:hypothetical protein
MMSLMRAVIVHWILLVFLWLVELRLFVAAHERMFSMSKKATGKSKGRSEIHDLKDALPDAEVEQATGGAVSQQVAMSSTQLHPGTAGSALNIPFKPPAVAPTTW